MKFSIITALDQKNGIGKNGTLPWHLPEDLKYFSNLTKGKKGQRNAVIMGRVTWESLPNNFKPLPDRLNIVISRNDQYPVPKGVLLYQSLNKALEELPKHHVNQAFVIGGSSIYQEALNHPECDRLYITYICQEFNCDTFFPSIDPNKFVLVEESELLTSVKEHIFKYLVYKKISN